MTINVTQNKTASSPRMGKFRAILLAGFSFGLFILGVSQAFNGISIPCDSPLPIQTKCLEFGRAEYERLKLGMPLDAVEAILGRGIETSQTPTTVTFVWKNPSGSSITVVFDKDGLLESKSQSGLQ